MAGGFFLLHIIPLDGKLFDDPEQAIFSLVILNLAVFVLLILALKSVKEGRKKAARDRRKAAVKQRQSEPPLSMAESSRAALPKPVFRPAAAGKAKQTSRSLVTPEPTSSKKYSRPAKK